MLVTPLHNTIVLVLMVNLQQVVKKVKMMVMRKSTCSLMKSSMCGNTSKMVNI